MITVKRLNLLVVLVMLIALAVPVITYASVPEGVAERSSVTEVEFTGVVSAMEEGSWVVDGQTVKIGPGTEVEGPLSVGDVVKVHARLDSDGDLVAREIEASDDFQGNDNDDNSNVTDVINNNDNGDDPMNSNANDDHMNSNNNDGENMNGNDNDDDMNSNATDDHMNSNANDHDSNDNDHDSNDNGHDNDDD